MGNFYSRLSYSFGNEDWKTEQKALKIQPDSKVLSVTASGDRPLNLLALELKELITIDTNPMQNALFDLKRAAIKHLEYTDYLTFLGADPETSPSQERLQIYARLQHELSEMSVALWKNDTQKIIRGVLYEGAVEKLLKKVSFLIRPFRGQKIDELFSFDDLETQKVYLKESWHSYFWKKAFHLSLHPWLTRLFAKDPGLYAYVDKDIHIGNHIYDKLHDSLDRFLAKESILLSLILRGIVDRKQFPPYLSKEGFDQIKKRIDRVQYQTSDMASYLKTVPDNSFDCFSCSDIASYISIKDFNEITHEIARTAKPGARFCIRQFLSNQKIPPHLEKHFRRDTALEAELEQEDRCFVYRFMCGTIAK